MGDKRQSGFDALGNSQALKALTTQTAEEIGEWLERHDFAEYKEKFLEHNITGSCIPLLDKKDLEDIGVDKAGDRILLLDLLDEYKVATSISNRTEAVMKWHQYHYTCCHPFSNVYYTLTGSAIEVVHDSWIMGLTKESIDIATITDVTLTARGCGGCCYSTVIVEAKKGDIRMRISRANAVKVHTAIKRAWEGYQAGKTKGR
jgi:hypothetical protein